MVSGQVPANEQGEIQGILTSLMSASSIIGPPLMSGLFYHFTQPTAAMLFPGAPFILGGILMGISTLLVFRALRK
jgi:DHA1 family tetracycline resistance protein-like MFS transporter